MKLQLFLTTVEEYKLFAEQLPFKQNDASSESYDEFSYVAIQTRLILLRKYICRNDSVHIIKVIEEAAEQFPEDSDYLKELATRYHQDCEGSLSQILVDGTKLNLYESIEDILYGLYLHADSDKILRLSRTNVMLRFFCARRFVVSIEAILFGLYDYLKQKSVSPIIEGKGEKAPIVYLGNPNSEAQDIKESPYWGNIYGHDATKEELIKSCKKNTLEENQILKCAIAFLDALAEPKISITKMENMVFQQTRKDWADFSEAKNFYEKIHNPGISNKVRFNENKDVAYVRVFPNVENPFMVSTPHVLSDVVEITLIKTNFTKRWKVFAFGARVDPYKHNS